MGGGMGMMGGGMGMMGGGMGMMGGGMGGGFRSVPPTGLPETTLAPHHTRHLPTAMVSLTGPRRDTQGPAIPEKGQTYEIGSIGDLTNDPRAQVAMTRLAQEKAPQTVAQLVLWNVGTGLDWQTIGRISQSQKWANANELTLARKFVERLDSVGAGRVATDPGVLYWEAKADGVAAAALAEHLRTVWRKSSVLGLSAKEGVPPQPDGPALACKLEINAQAVNVKLGMTDPDAASWSAIGSFSVKRADLGQAMEGGDRPKLTEEQERLLPATRLGDAVADGLLNRVVRVHLSNGPRAGGKPSYKIRIENGSPFVLNGVALAGNDVSGTNRPTALAGFCLPPRKTLTAPAAAETVERLKLKEGVRLLAVDLSGL
jgi:hypothetical protein